jgi:hypothetical protein
MEESEVVSRDESRDQLGGSPSMSEGSEETSTFVSRRREGNEASASNRLLDAMGFDNDPRLEL